MSSVTPDCMKQPVVYVLFQTRKLYVFPFPLLYFSWKIHFFQLLSLRFVSVLFTVDGSVGCDLFFYDLPPFSYKKIDVQ